ncbi:hypothetical protein N8986_02305 [Flavobacteriaceae bacterium]|nr:hypothetical protein [Flavobacteriaceae bacterium]
MNYINELDNIYSELINQFKDNNERNDVLELIDEIQNRIEDLTPNN